MSEHDTTLVEGSFGVVSATDELAASAAMRMLEMGGNAFDAAVTATMVLQVVEPHLSGPAGETSVVFFARADGRPRVLCGQGPAPGGATPEHFASLGLGLVPGTGVLSAPVPGAFDAWMTLLRDYGTKSVREVLDPAIGHAERGHRLLASTVTYIRRHQEVLRNTWPSSAAVYLPDGSCPEPGELHRNSTLADTYRRILSESEAAGGSRERQIEAARGAWYRGFVADEIERFVHRTHSDPVLGTATGVLRATDLAGYEATYEAPAMLEWRDWTLCKPGPWSQGPVFLQQLALLDSFGDLVRDVGSAEFAHVVVEAAKLAYADREAFYGDAPGIPLDELLAPRYIVERARLITDDASWEIRPGSPGGRQPRLPALVPDTVDAIPRVEEARRQATGGQPAKPGGDTCHVAVADRWGNFIAATPSGGFLMSSPVIESLGFPLSTRLEMTWLEPGLPSTLAACRRPRTTLSPTLALRDGEPVLAFGTPGADMQEQWSLGFFLNVCAGFDLQAAMDQPRWHSHHFASSLYPRLTRLGRVSIESSAPEWVIADLRRRGHDVFVREPRSLGRLCAVARDPATGRLFAAADPRQDQNRALRR